MARHTMRFAVFTNNGMTHVYPGLWTRPEAAGLREYNDLASWLEFARRAEEACLDAIFFADGVGGGGEYPGDNDTLLRVGMSPPRNDPTALIPAMATVTEHLGFMVTSSMLQEHPFHFARRMSTLDHLTRGRLGWNIVTAYNPAAWRNFGIDGALPHAERYAWAQEYADVVYKLWEGSWDDDAVVADLKNGEWARPGSVHPIDHIGERYRVAGPHLVEPSPQRTPLLLQAGGSPDGRRFAASHAEIQFIVTPNREAARTFISEMTRAATDIGREPNSMSFMKEFVFIVGSTEEEAQRRSAEIDAALDLPALISQLNGLIGVNLSGLDPETPLAEVRTEGIQSILDGIIASLPPGVSPTLEELVFSRLRRTRVVGTPDQIADELTAWQQAGVDGVAISMPTRPGSLLEFTQHVMPVLQKRGIAQTEYAEGTLRRKLLGRGDRLPGGHPAASYRRAPLRYP